jgi:hypothetical protein
MDPLRATQQEGRIALALAALKQGKCASIRGAAESYDVPYTTLRRRVHGQIARCDRYSAIKLQTH